MEFGSFMEFSPRPGRSQAEAFAEAFAHVRQAEEQGLDAVWLSESHFSPERSLMASPLIVAAAVGGATRRIKIGTAVNLIPLENPLRLAEEVATLDHVCEGRFEFGIGRSSAPGSYEGYGIPYAESRDRFRECLDILKCAWTQERFSYHGNFFDYDNVCVTPKPRQQPYPLVRIAATTDETFPQIGAMGAPIFIGLRTAGLGRVEQQVESYKRAWRDAGHKGTPDIALRLPVYVAETESAAVNEPEQSFMRQFRRLGGQLAETTATTAAANNSAERQKNSAELQSLTWDTVQQEKVAVGTPSMVVERLTEIGKRLSLSSVIAEFNAGEQVPAEAVERSLRLFCEEVAQALR